MTEDVSWISVGALAHAFAEDNYAPQATLDLAGKRHSLYLEEGGILEYQFLDEQLLLCNASEVPDPLPGSVDPGGSTGAGSSADATSSTGATSSTVEEASVATPYFAARLRDGLYFVDHVRADEPAATFTSVFDFRRGAATVIAGRLPGEAESRRPLAERIAAGEELTAVSTLFASAAIDSSFTEATHRHSPTGDMVGGRVEYTYSPSEQYEHVYLNERFYTWHCLRGSEKGLADTDRCHYYKIDEDLYLFVWREKIVPTLGVVVVDFDTLRTTGKIFGYDSVAGGKLSNFIVGARARVIDAPGRVGSGG